MRIPLSWLREHTDADASTTPEQVQAALVRVGLEEEALHGGDITGPVVVGRVVERVPEPQKNGKTINWCQVDVGAANGGVRGIVCGAHNFDAGDHVVVSLPGAVLPGGFAISARKTYGHVSDGMICSSLELGVGTDHDGIVVLTPEQVAGVAVGDDALPLLGLDDVVVEVNVTPDRGYCFSLRGLGREYALGARGAFTDPVDPARFEAAPADGRGHEVRLTDDDPVRGRPGCTRYVARTVRGVDAAAPSPDWMQRLLQQLGMRPISLAVDVTNYVMLVTGQPLHAFDLATLGGPVVVRRAAPGERLTTLDGVDRALHAEDLLVTVDEPAGSRVLAIAGVMGGADGEVTDTTRDLLVESALFDPVTVARSSRRHKLSTEASRRFERGVDRDLAHRAAELAVRLLVEHAGGTADGVTDVDERTPVAPIRMAADLPARLVGRELDAETVDGALRAVGCEVERSEDDLLVTPASWRPDLVEGADLVEEVARVAGYDQIVGVLPPAPAGRGLTRAQRLRRLASTALAEHGYVEVQTYPFVAPGRLDALQLPDDDDRRRALRLANPLSEEAPLLRTALLETLGDAARRNHARGTLDLALFEVGRVFRPGAADRPQPPRPEPATRPDAA
ncbi:phenylalanine--tRNA ligase subunit beta, partial [Angustibacter aerolatus]